MLRRYATKSALLDLMARLSAVSPGYLACGRWAAVNKTRDGTRDARARRGGGACNLHLSSKLANTRFGEVGKGKHGAAQSFLVDMRSLSHARQTQVACAKDVGRQKGNEKRNPVGNVNAYLAEEVRLVLECVAGPEQRDVACSCAVER